jgi:hypothetical protein
MNLNQVLKALYASEINFTITTLWDGGYDYELCSAMEWAGGKVKMLNADSPEALAAGLHRLALERYPNSKYAKENFSK